MDRARNTRAAMQDDTTTRPRRPGRPTDGPFRVCTVQDFGGPPPPKRKSSHYTLACQMCRSRKIKCVPPQDTEGQRGSGSPCQPCLQCKLECSWGVVDGRKKRKQRVAVVALSPPDHPTTPPLPLDRTQNPHDFSSAAAPAVVGGEPSIPAHEAEGSASQNRRVGLDSPGMPSNLGTGQSDGNHARLASDGDTAGNLTAAADGPLSRGAVHIPGLASIFEAHIDPTDFQTEQQFLAEFHPGEGVDMPQDWPDLQNFVMGLDFMGAGAGLGGFHMPDQPFPQAVTPAAQPAHGSDSASRPRLIRLRYYRRFGPTAVVPGLRKLSIVVDPREEDTPASVADCPETESTSSLWAGSSPASAASHSSRLFDSVSGVPRSDIITHILDTFFERFGGHFPFHHSQILGGHVLSGEASSFLLNTIAALTLRFCHFDGQLAFVQSRYEAPWQRGSPFLKKAKEQLVPLLSIPAPEVVAGLIILAWAEFGDNNEAGLWMFAGMAIRMAQDLGFHRIPETNLDADMTFHDQARPSLDGRYILTDEQSAIHQQKARLVMFWSAFILDVCVSLGTGRPPTIRRSEIEVSVPTPSDMKQVQLDFSEAITMGNMIFPETVRFMLLYSEAVEALNERGPARNSDGGLAIPDPHRETHLAQIRDTMLHNYQSLPSTLAFNIDNYREASSSGQSGLFLILHLFFFTFMTLLSDIRSRDARHGLHQARSRRPSAANVLQNPGQNQPSRNGQRQERQQQQQQQQGMAIMSCQKSVQVMTIAQLVDENGYLATPFINHCLFVAASTILQQQGDVPGSLGREESRDDGLLSLITGTDYDFLCQKLKDQGHYFGAINSVVTVLEQRKRAFANGGESANHDNLDEQETEDGMERVVGVRDPGIVNRYTIPR